MICNLAANDTGRNPVLDRKERRLWLFSKLGPDDRLSHMNTNGINRQSPLSLTTISLKRWDWMRPTFTESAEPPVDSRWNIRILSQSRQPFLESIGEVLILTDDLDLVLSLRHDLLLRRHDLNWTSNFWLAMSYLHNHRFAALVFDARVRSVEEEFVPDFVEEYGRGSKGKRIFLPAPDMSPVLRRLLREKGCLVLEKAFSTADLVQGLELIS